MGESQRKEAFFVHLLISWTILLILYQIFFQLKCMFIIYSLILCKEYVHDSNKELYSFQLMQE